MSVEAKITINDKELTEAQSLTIRVALQDFASSLIEEGLGDDEVGKSITQGYLDRIKELNRLILNISY